MRRTCCPQILTSPQLVAMNASGNTTENWPQAHGLQTPRTTSTGARRHPQERASQQRCSMLWLLSTASVSLKAMIDQACTPSGVQACVVTLLSLFVLGCIGRCRSGAGGRQPTAKKAHEYYLSVSSASHPVSSGAARAWSAGDRARPCATEGVAFAIGATYHSREAGRACGIRYGAGSEMCLQPPPPFVLKPTFSGSLRFD